MVSSEKGGDTVRNDDLIAADVDAAFLPATNDDDDHDDGTANGMPPSPTPPPPFNPRSESSLTTTTNSNNKPVLTLYDQYPVYLQEDWTAGIGGGLWSTGLAMAQYFSTRHFYTQLQRLQQWKQQQQTERKITVATTEHPPIRVLELGSGNGFLSVCLVVAAMMRPKSTERKDGAKESPEYYYHQPLDSPIPVQVVATDTAEHLSLMERTIRSNLQRLSSVNGATAAGYLNLSRSVSVKEYLWGESSSSTSTDGNSNNTKLDTSETFDLIIGSDLAYRDELYDPLIATLQQFHHGGKDMITTTTLLGVTMTDTKPIFFQKLIQAGFQYEKLADHLLPPEFRGGGSRQFGIFAIFGIGTTQ